MAADLQRMRWEAKRRLKSGLDAAAGGAAALLLSLIHRCDRVWITNFGGAFTRTIGPWLSEHRTGQANLRAAFPEKSDAEIETILRGVWDNLGRTGAEIAHLDHICSGDRYKRTYLDYSPESIERFLGVIHDGKPAVIFRSEEHTSELQSQ